MTDFTYERRMAAHYGSTIVTVPDQVADAQREFDGKTFPALRSDGRKVRVRLDGEAYGLHTSGTGDMIVRAA